MSAREAVLRKLDRIMGDFEIECGTDVLYREFLAHVPDERLADAECYPCDGSLRLEWDDTREGWWHIAEFTPNLLWVCTFGPGEGNDYDRECPFTLPALLRFFFTGHMNGSAS